MRLSNHSLVSDRLYCVSDADVDVDCLVSLFLRRFYAEENFQLQLVQLKGQNGDGRRCNRRVHMVGQDDKRGNQTERGDTFQLFLLV